MERVLSRLTIFFFAFFILLGSILKADYKDAVLEYRKGNYKKAIDIMVPYVNRYPDWEFAHRLIGMCYFKLKNYDKAVKALEKAASLNSTEGSLYIALAESYFNLGEYEKSLSVLKKGKKFLSSKSEFYLFYRISGIIYYKLGKCKKTVEFILKSFSFKKGDEKDYFHLGACYLKLKMFDKSTEALKKSLEINPYFGPSFKLLMNLKLKRAESLMKEKKFEEASKLFQEFLKRFPNRPRVKLNLALCYISMKKFDSAKKLLLEIVDQLPKNYRVLFYLGYVFEKEKEYEKALFYYKRAQKILSSPDVRKAIKRVKSNLGTEK